MKLLHSMQATLIALLLPISVLAQVQDCDRLAASPLDPQKQTAGLSFDKINPNLAIPACKKATENNPQVARLWFQYGRALEKGNKLPDAIYAYQAAAKLKSGAANNNIGELYRDGKGFQKDLNKAEEYFTLAANLNSIEGKNNLLALGRIAVSPQASSSASRTTAFAPSAAGNSPSFDCSKASSPTEKMICQSPIISKLDVRLSEVYKEIRKTDASIVNEQRTWLKEARACEDEKCLENAYGIRVEALENRLAKLEQTTNQGTPQAEADANANKGLSTLFNSGGYWVDDEKIKKSNSSCRGLIGRPNAVAVLKKYEPTMMTILFSLPQGVKEYRVPTRFENVKVSGNLVTFDRYDKVSNGALIGGTYQLDLSQQALHLLRSHTCQNCSESQMMIHKMHLNDEPSGISYWCVGNY